PEGGRVGCAGGETVEPLPGPAAAQLHARQGRRVRRHCADGVVQLLPLRRVQRREPARDQKSRIRRPLRHLLRVGPSAVLGSFGGRAAECVHRGSDATALNRRRSSAPAAPTLSTTASAPSNHQLEAPPSWRNGSVLTPALATVGAAAAGSGAGAPAASA